VLIFLNGRFVPEERAVVSVFDRGFLYGDGLFEAIRIRNGQPFRWRLHLERFQQGAEHLKIRPPFSPEAILKFARQLIKKNKMPDALLRLSLSRGIGQRGYSPAGAKSPTFAMTLHPAPTIDRNHPPCWKLITASPRLPTNEPLARFNTAGRVVEGTTSNLFWIAGGRICTPPLVDGVLPGVTRRVVLEICRALELPTREIAPRPKELLSAQGVFLSMSSWGIVEGVSLDGKRLRRAAVIREIQDNYENILRDETA
jgi:branched-subunit amino acid aminotransferase/4-amino-4-deoxychorismate lyase